MHTALSAAVKDAVSQFSVFFHALITPRAMA